MKISELDTPSLLADRGIMLDNLSYMLSYAKENGCTLRPHTKTHKTPRIAKLCEELGAVGIAVAKTEEAEVMAENGLSDIFIANEIAGAAKLERIKKLAQKINISFGADCVEHLKLAEQVFSDSPVPAQIMIEIEVGEVRSGVIKDEDFLKLLEFFKSAEHVVLRGLFSHDGNCYRAKDMEELVSISKGAQERTLHFAAVARANGFECPVISYGATPTFMNRVPILEGITELRPGTFIFMDAAQGKAVGNMGRCAATVLATVMSKPTSQRVILDVGAKGLTMQKRSEGICAVEGLGIVKGFENVYIQRMFDEHAIIENEEFNKSVSIGQKVRIIPVHICPVCNLYDTLYLTDGEDVVEELPILCRGKLK